MKRIILILMLLLLSACSSTPTAAVSTPEATGGEPASDYPAGYPVPQVNPTENREGYPAPEATPTAEPSPTPDATKGNIKGQILLKGQPVTHGVLYFSEVIKDENGQEIVVTFDRYSPFRSTMDANGNFYVANLPPGRYGVVFDLVTNSFLLMTPDQKQSLIVTVAENETLDMGALDYQDLPTE